MLKLAKNNSPTYDYYSEGDGADPASASVTLTGAGGTLNTNVITAYLIATTYRYSGIELSVINEQAGINWKLSLDNATFTDTISPADMNALAADVVVPVYVRGTVTNDGSVSTGIYTTPDIQISATENPS